MHICVGLPLLSSLNLNHLFYIIILLITCNFCSKAVSFWQRTTGLFGHTQGVQIWEQFHCLGNETDINQCTTRSNWAAHNTPIMTNNNGELSCEGEEYNYVVIAIYPIGTSLDHFPHAS